MKSLWFVFAIKLIGWLLVFSVICKVLFGLHGTVYDLSFFALDLFYLWGFFYLLIPWFYSRVEISELVISKYGFGYGAAIVLFVFVWETWAEGPYYIARKKCERVLKHQKNSNNHTKRCNK